MWKSAEISGKGGAQTYEANEINVLEKTLGAPQNLWVKLAR
jgi:hypothetical protein